MPTLPRPRALTAFALPIALAGCAHRADVALAPAPAAPPPPRPELAVALAAVTPPPLGADGGYRTINSGLDADRTVWHVRAALNVAAIGCRGPGDEGTVAAYNAMLKSKKAVLAHANLGFRASVKAEGGDGDAYMTRLYNYFAMPAAKPGFCAAAAMLAPQAAAAAPDAFPAFAQTALPVLEAPFIAAFREVDTYRLASAEWDRRYGDTQGTRLADSVPPAPLSAAPAPPRAVVVTAAATSGLPIGASAMAGHYDLPRAVVARRIAIPVAAARATAATSPASATALPRLAYADLGQVTAWQPARRETLASR